VTGDLRKLHNKELHNLYCSPNIIKIIKSRKMRCAGRVARMRGRGMHIGYWWKNQNVRALGRPRRRWLDNIKINLGEIGWDGMDWVDMAQDRDQWRVPINTAMNVPVP
jgi:hypothetical protein